MKHLQETFWKSKRNTGIKNKNKKSDRWQQCLESTPLSNSKITKRTDFHQKTNKPCFCTQVWKPSAQTNNYKRKTSFAWHSKDDRESLGKLFGGRPRGNLQDMVKQVKMAATKCNGCFAYFQFGWYILMHIKKRWSFDPDPLLNTCILQSMKSALSKVKWNACVYK